MSGTSRLQNALLACSVIVGVGFSPGDCVVVAIPMPNRPAITPIVWPSFGQLFTISEECELLSLSFADSAPNISLVIFRPKPYHPTRRDLKIILT